MNANDLRELTIQILTRGVTRKLGYNISFETTNEEDLFFIELVKGILDSNLNPNLLYFEPMSNKGFSVSYSSYPIGKIKLRGRKSYIQVLKGLYSRKSFDDLSIQEYISHIPEWIKYIKYCIK
jgi:hypothetical protein